MVVSLRRPGQSLALILLLIAPRSVGFLSPTASGSPGNSVFVPVLIYHHVNWLKPTDNSIERGLTVLPSEFKAQVGYLIKNHYHLVSAAALVRFLRFGSGLPSKPVVLTFDDGYIDMFGTVYSLLRSMHLTATFFIVPGFLDTRRYLSWKQVEQMAGAGMEIEAHSMTHPDLTTVPAAQQWTEVAQSRHELEQRLHRAVRVFAYPYGAHNASVLSAVSKAGYWGGFTTREGWWENRGEVLTLPRVYVDIDDSPQIFAGRLRADPVALAADPT
jgi:peptidoglycan/xylan/chitin deacetylase (PgdA/CDA1 family)